MNISYHTRRGLRRFITALVWVLIIGLLAWCCWMIWLQRYVVYSRDGVTLNFDRSSADISGEEAVPPDQRETVAIHYNEGEEMVDVSHEMTQLLGYYADTDALLSDLDTIVQQIQSMEPDMAVMLDVKSIYGNFYYSTGIADATVSDSLNTSAMDSLIAYLKDSDLYAIARLPAFRDRSFGEDHVSSGIPVEGGYLWADEDNCYWLDPADEDTITYLTQIINELRGLGFDEVVFTDFYFPQSEEIVYESELTTDEIIKKAAEDLVSTCTTNSFVVSFQSDASFPLPEGRSRLYIDGIQADQVAATAAGIQVDDAAVNLVFLAATNDTRYNAYGALRSLSPG